MDLLGFIILAFIVLAGGLVIVYFIGLLAIIHAMRVYFHEWEETWGEK